MPSKIPSFNFRNGKLRLRLTKTLKIDENKLNKFASLATEHVANFIEANGTCPICRKSFDDCEHFRSLDDE